MEFQYNLVTKDDYYEINPDPDIENSFVDKRDAVERLSIDISHDLIVHSNGCTYKKVYIKEPTVFPPANQKLTPIDVEEEERFIHDLVVENLTEEELTEDIISDESTKVREIRHRLLEDCDWVVTRSTETGESAPAEWTSYRTALRNITNNERFPFLEDEDWPTKPS